MIPREWPTHCHAELVLMREPYRKLLKSREQAQRLKQPLLMPASLGGRWMSSSWGPDLFNTVLGASAITGVSYTFVPNLSHDYNPQNPSIRGSIGPLVLERVFELLIPTVRGRVPRIHGLQFFPNGSNLFLLANQSTGIPGSKER